MSPLPAGARWSDAALALFESTGAIAVSAGAGAGKTTALVELLRRLLAGTAPAGPVAPGEVVAITFTDRAGAELVERLGQELALGVRALREAGDAAGAGRLEDSLRELPSMAVGTIHGWAARLLREHALEVGVDPDFAVLDEDAAGELLAGASLGAAVAALDAGDPVARHLSVALGGAAELATSAAELVRARATRGLQGVPEGVPPRDGALQEAREELLRALDELAGLAGQATTPTGKRALEGLRARLAAIYEAAPLPGPVAEARRLVAAEESLAGWRLGKRDPPELGAARSRVREGAEGLLLAAAEVEAAPLAATLAGLVAETERRYREAKDRAGALDFDDLLVRARDLLRDRAALREALQARVRALLVDEYQDVNGLQAELFDLVAAPAGAGPAPALRVAVGDARQSIYRFRGADVGVFADLVLRLGRGEGRVVHLRENHRSTPEVVGLVNALLAGDAGGLGVPYGDEDLLQSCRAATGEPAAELLVAAAGAAAGDTAGDTAGEAAAVAAAEVAGDAGARRIQEARAVAARAAEVVAAGTPPGEVAVLLRRLTHVGVFERAMREAGLPVRVARGGGFWQASEVRDLGELCAAVDDPGDGIAWAALLRSPLCALSDGSLVALARRGLRDLADAAPEEAGSLLEAARGGAAPEREAERLAAFLEVMRELRAARGRLDAGEILALAVSRLDLDAALLAGPDGERRAANVRKAVDLASRLAARGASVGQVAARFRRLARRPPREPEADADDGDAISLLTVHQAKGLEWSVVFLPELSARPPAAPRRPVLDEAGRIASPLLSADEGAMETATTARLREAAARAEAAEGRRLLYVALTRARDRLVLSGAEGRPGAGSWAEVVARAPASLLVRRPAPAWPPPVRESTSAPAVPLAAPVLRPPSRDLPLRMPVTSLAEHVRCPIRHHLSLRLRLPEPKAGLHGDDDPERATVRGTLAHALLAEVDLAASPRDRRALLLAASSRHGEDARRPGTRRVVDDVDRWIGGPAGQRLAAALRAGELRRELPFLLRLDGPPTCYLEGVVDALRAGADAVEVVDFKYATFHEGAAERYRFQLAAYALAASRAFPGRPVRATLHFLRGDGREVDVTPTPEELASLASAIPREAGRALSGVGASLRPVDVGRSRDLCAAEGCGWVRRCFGPPGSIPA